MEHGPPPTTQGLACAGRTGAKSGPAINTAIVSICEIELGLVGVWDGVGGACSVIVATQPNLALSKSCFGNAFVVEDLFNLAKAWSY